MSVETPATWPRVQGTINEDGTGEVTISGSVHPVSTDSLDDARTAIVGLVAETARKLGRDVRATMTDPDGQWPLVIHGDGTVESDATAEAKPRTVPDVADEPPAAPVEPVTEAA